MICPLLHPIEPFAPYNHANYLPGNCTILYVDTTLTKTIVSDYKLRNYILKYADGAVEKVFHTP